jgi:thioredoxin reductase (NADPH)
MQNKKIEIIWDSVVEDVIGDKEPKNVKGIKIKNVKTNNIEELKLDGVFIARQNWLCLKVQLCRSFERQNQ